MKLNRRKWLRLGLPLIVAALYLAQATRIYSETGQLSTHFFGGVFVFLAVFLVLWFVERHQG